MDSSETRGGTPDPSSRDMAPVADVIYYTWPPANPLLQRYNRTDSYKCRVMFVITAVHNRLWYSLPIIGIVVGVYLGDPRSPPFNPPHHKWNTGSFILVQVTKRLIFVKNPMLSRVCVVYRAQ